MNSHALAVLEFHRVLKKVAERAGTEPGRERVLGLVPSTDPDQVRRELARVDETRDLMASVPDWAPPHFPDLRAALEVLGAEGTVLSPDHLLGFLGSLVSSRELAGALGSWVEARSAEGPRDAGSGDTPAASARHLSALLGRLPVRRETEAMLSRIVDDEGVVRDDASPRLRTLRRQLRAQRSTIVQRLERFIRELPESHRVEGASVSVRDGRFVVPIRREGRSAVGGVVRGESATGGTLFVEPPVATRLMGELEELEREEAAEVHRILRDATGRLRPISGELHDGFEAQVDFDTLWARAATARDWEAVVPEILDPEQPGTKIEDGRHPLLLEQGGEVVPFSLELGPEERAVVLSGPNTGGKTVLLKALGLIHALAQSGVAPPVGSGSRLTAMRDVFADIGDEQSIAESLSTFSAHIENTRGILAGAGPGTLVLVDEMGTGTDPNEGAALARAVLERLVELGALSFVTSHLGALKRLDAEGSGIVNASLLFDLDRLSPTFRLQKGRPGRSFGLAVARRLGLPEEVLAGAEAYVGSEELDVEALLESLQRKERELDEALATAEAARSEAEEQRTTVEADREEIEAREHALERDAREQARQLLLDARKEVEAAIREIRSADIESRAAAETRARRRVEAAARRQRERVPAGVGSRSAAEVEEVRVGDRVRVRSGGALGVVREVGGRRLTVEVGGVRLQLPREEVVGAPGPAEEASDAPKPGAEWQAPDPLASHEVDLRGLRVNEVDLSLSRALDDAVVGNLSEVRIVHGKGSGAVKARVRELLRTDSRVNAFRPGEQGEGGSGVTVAMLR